MNAHLDRVVLSRKTKRVPAHRVDHIFFPLITDSGSIHRRLHNLSSDLHEVRCRTDTGTYPGSNIFFLSIIDIDRILFPVLTPLALNGGVVVLCHDAFLLHFISLKAVQIRSGISPAAAAFTRIRELPGPVRLPDSFSGCRTTKSPSISIIIL